MTDDLTSRAEPDGLSVGDFVQWDSSGGTARGKIDSIELLSVVYNCFACYCDKCLVVMRIGTRSAIGIVQAVSGSVVRLL